MNVLTVYDLKKSYLRGFVSRKSTILHGLSFSVPPGKITGFLGLNGAGKTTCMRCVLGLDFPDSGRVEFFGTQKLGPEVQRRIGFLPERPYFYEHLTGEEFLRFYAHLTRTWKRGVLQERIRYLMGRVGLEHAQRKILRNYSKGMLQRVGLAQALIHDPEFVILDEPMSGLDPDGRVAVAEIINETAKRGTAVFFSSHLIHDAERLCDRVLVLKEGRCLFEGPTQELVSRGNQESEIRYLANGLPRSERAENYDQLQKQLAVLVANGAIVVEIRRIGASLEQIFVNMTQSRSVQ